MRGIQLALLSFFLLCTWGVSGQDAPTLALDTPVNNPPVSLEATFGYDAMIYQLMINKKLKSIPKLGFFSITSLNSSWEKGPYDGVMTQGLLTYSVLKGLDVVAGFHYTDVTGARPSAGLMYSYGTPEFLVVVNPRIDLYKDAVFETMMLVEYKPELNHTFRWYSRIQALYGLTTNDGAHARSYLLARVGLTHKEFTFGLAGNLDYYGPHRGDQKNAGVFIATALF